jgi:hypothetical protein
MKCGVLYSVMTLPLVARGCRGGWRRLVCTVLIIVVRSPRTCPVLGLSCFWAWVTQQPRPKLVPGGELRRAGRSDVPRDVDLWLIPYHAGRLPFDDAGGCAPAPFQRTQRRIVVYVRCVRQKKCSNVRDCCGVKCDADEFRLFRRRTVEQANKARHSGLLRARFTYHATGRGKLLASLQKKCLRRGAS